VQFERPEARKIYVLDITLHLIHSPKRLQWKL